MRIALAYDGGAAASPPDAAGVMEAVDGVAAALTRLGHAAVPVPINRPLGWSLGRLLEAFRDVDAVLNLVEGLDGDGTREAAVAGLLEGLALPMTGASSETLSLCRRKDRVNAVLAAHGVAVPRWAVVQVGSMPAWDAYPAIVKPLGQDGSLGIHEDSVVQDPWQLQAVLARPELARTGNRALVQTFVPGRELNVGIVGQAVLPVSEIVFEAGRRVVSYAAKWSPDSVDWGATTAVCPADIDPGLRARAVSLARAAWDAVDGVGYGRVDLRTGPDGELYVLEVNPNPDLSPTAGLARMADAAGWGFDGLVARILEEALA